MTEKPQSVQIEAFEHVLAVPGIALLRVLATRSRRRSAGSRPDLVITDEQSTCRFAPLPAPDDPGGVLRVAYSVPVELLEQDGVTFALEFQNGSALTLPLPTVGSARLTARGGEQEPEQSGTAEAVPDADLEEDPLGRIATFDAELTRAVKAASAAAERATQAEKSNAESSAALRELEIWREELERRLAEVTSELAATKKAFEDAERERTRLDGELAEMQSQRDAAQSRRDAAQSQRDAAQSQRDAAQAQAQTQAAATLATSRGELHARVHAAQSDDLEREIEVSRGEADRLQAAVVSLESQIRTRGQGQLDPLHNGSDREPTAVSSALDDMHALQRELEMALASERKANLELVMLTAETQARLQAQTELKQAAGESRLTR